MLDLVPGVLAIKNLEFVAPAEEVRDVNFDGSVPEGFHGLVAFELQELRAVGMTYEDGVHRDLRELLGLDLLLL